MLPTSFPSASVASSFNVIIIGRKNTDKWFSFVWEIRYFSGTNVYSSLWALCMLPMTTLMRSLTHSHPSHAKMPFLKRSCVAIQSSAQPFSSPSSSRNNINSITTTPPLSSVVFHNKCHVQRQAKLLDAKRKKKEIYTTLEMAKRNSGKCGRYAPMLSTEEEKRGQNGSGITHTG